MYVYIYLYGPSVRLQTPPQKRLNSANLKW